ncbi:hypothetical protein HanXRQr2_Chr10g0422281 [Helianthus annuus]|uniref:Uncharacterized protein n=1 Tax=Helianthus annuus TaxID=4232 RepID=A0A9K3HV10_HELAN|nr:hypothetical protein HanXRQr2_Chr10g0422281 [Helianthus annuus]KAJ0520083.1 hypothetical protein HanIR_Chr10g0455481 [Helianthus annuus]KAJ0528656.1 hypothetical protein HanHA89_Chr10g0368861 [Helianthus annuus]KAJ0695567.1 hypothetical protein HanLR1_Chr10g0347031 [Helianthus annuus]KAJ0699046.1 hypothetical protein HanOQP8_Chr10g0351451 [Helianthus annuus]
MLTWMILMQATMDHSRRQSTPVKPRKRQGRDEEYDFLRSSPPIRPPPPKMVERTPKPIRSHQAMATTKSPKAVVVPPPRLSSHQAMAQKGPSKAPPPARLSVSPRTNAPSKPKALHSPPACNNILLAGYLAHEFLNKGTLFGEVYDPNRANNPQTSSNNSKEGKEMSCGYDNKDKGKGKAIEPDP